ncbi:hypothetical protein [Methylobacterium pseudosasicola]|uniref:hypothetical protein n=1 Tax=Methylobacterium pseudosasicola TaxID=582667 RepID=UPI001428B05B|nr:hypothetical protein [Methylobacterium pseudosasicola]
MTFGLSLFALCGGALFAVEAVRRPEARHILEGLAGSLIVSGLALLGMGLSILR